MGTSTSTRRVVVEDNDGTGVVQISESVVKRIRGLEGSEHAVPHGDGSRFTSKAPPSSGKPLPAFSGVGDDDALTRPKSRGEMDSLQQMEAYYSNKLMELESRNAELQKITNEQFVKAVQEVEQKFLKHTCSPVCQDLQTKVYECYLGNPSKTLTCSAEVRAFSTCVERARQNALYKKG